MNTRRFLTAGLGGLLVASLTLTGCGSRSADTGGSGSSDKKVAKIGVIAPLSGPLSAMGQGIKNSVDLAIKQANDSNAIPGWKLELAAEDDQAAPDTGKNAATKLAGDSSVVGVVGPLNSSVGQAVQPIFNSANITLVSPANTNPTLTKGADLNNPKRTYASYFRVCTTDAIQGPFAARYLLDAGIKQVATVHDKKAYGQGLVDAFTSYFKANGGTIVDAETINPDDKDFNAVISKIKGTNPQAVYYGGEYPQAAPLSQQMKNAGLKVPLMGGDGIYDDTYIKTAGAAADGDLATSVGAPPETLPSAKAFIDAYSQAGYKDGYAAYGPYAYDAANAIIEALKTSLKDAKSAKDAQKTTVQAMANVTVDGATGKFSFDEFGDTTSKTLTVYKVTGGKWVADKTGSM